MLNRLRKLDRWLVRINRTLREWLGLKPTWPILVAPYRGYGNRSHILLRGRVLKDRRIVKDEVNSTWRALMNSYKRFNSREVAGARVRIHIERQSYQVLTDEEGYFFLNQPLREPLPSTTGSWCKARVVLKETPRRKVDATAEANLLIPRRQAKFGFISDVDDTIMKTDVTSLLKLRVLYHTLLKTADLRQTFTKAASFFQALQYGQSDEAVNPVFYVSNSPWNLYDLLEEFLSLNDLPDGPILLRDFGPPHQDHPEGYLGHKHSSILRIMDTYPDLPFLLIGDSGEKDPYIYEAVAKARPGRVQAIYIRDVQSIRRARRVRRFIEETGVDMKLVENYQEAARDAAERGLLDWANFEKIAKSRPA